MGIDLVSDANVIETIGSNNHTKEASNRDLRFLIAEDDEVNQRVIVGLLSQLPCQCDVVGNGAEAVAALMRSTYDIVFMDIQMPVMDGVTATREIRALGGEIGQVPIVAVTAHAMEGDRERYLDAGMNNYVSKPIKTQSLITAVNNCTDRSFNIENLRVFETG
jgi:CheY-like chemotaxis protein